MQDDVGYGTCKQPVAVIRSVRQTHRFPMIESGSHASRPCGYSHSPENSLDVRHCPAADQSGEEVAAWLRVHGSPGEPVVVFFKQQALCQFRLDEIRAWRGRRVHLVEHGAFDEQGFAISRPRNISLRILKSSTPVVEAAVRGVTLQRCLVVNERDLSAWEETIARRMQGRITPER
jgi:hypothetical protein